MASLQYFVNMQHLEFIKQPPYAVVVKKQKIWKRFPLTKTAQKQSLRCLKDEYLFSALMSFINDVDAVCFVVIYTNNTTLDVWQQLDLVL